MVTFPASILSYGQSKINLLTGICRNYITYNYDTCYIDTHKKFILGENKKEIPSTKLKHRNKLMEWWDLKNHI